MILEKETDDHILAVTAWTLGQIGKHTPEHAKSIAVTNTLSKLLEVCNFQIIPYLKSHWYIYNIVFYHLNNSSMLIQKVRMT